MATGSSAHQSYQRLKTRHWPRDSLRRTANSQEGGTTGRVSDLEGADSQTRRATEAPLTRSRSSVLRSRLTKTRMAGSTRPNCSSTPRRWRNDEHKEDVRKVSVQNKTRRRNQDQFPKDLVRTVSGTVGSATSRSEPQSDSPPLCSRDARVRRAYRCDCRPQRSGNP